MRRQCHDRRGITLMEVLISIGILSIGLVSVLSLIPAGRFQTAKATALDRTTMLAMNAAADFVTRGFARPAGWATTPTSSFVVFDPLGPATFWSGTVSASLVTPRLDAATTGTAASLFSTDANAAVSNHLSRGDDDIRYTTEGRGDDDLPVPLWSVSGTSGPHVHDGAYSCLATLSGTTTTWNPGEYKTLTVVTFARRDASSVVQLFPTTSPTTDGSWTVDKTTVQEGMTLKELAKPGTLVLYKPAGGSPQWYRVLLASDMTPTASPSTWKLGLTCEQGEPDTSNAANRVYVFPGAVGSTQLLVKLEGTSRWND